MNAKLVNRLVLGFVLAFGLSAAVSADYPERPIDLVVGFKAGGGTDTYARSFAKIAPAHLNDQPIVVVNKPGGGGLIAGRFVADQPPTGYSLYLASAGSMVLKNLIKKQVVGTGDFKMVGTIGELTAGVFVPANSEITDLAQLLDKMSSSDKKLRWGHTGRGNTWHIAGVGLLAANDVKAKDIPFKGGAGVRGALTSAQIDFGVMGAHLGKGFEEDVRLLAVLSDKRHPAVPDAQTTAELGVEFIKVTTPMVIMAPKRLSDDIVAILSDAVQKIASDPGYVEILENAGLPVSNIDSAGTTEMLANSTAEWEKLIESIK